MADFIVRPDGANELEGALIFPEGSSPQILPGIPAGLWRVGRISWSSDPVEVVDPAPSETLALASREVTDGGALVQPYFLPPTISNLEYDAGGTWVAAEPRRIRDVATAMWDMRPPWVSPSAFGGTVTAIQDASGNGNHSPEIAGFAYEFDEARHWVTGSAEAYIEIPANIIRNVTGVTLFAAVRKTGTATADLFRIMAATTGTTWLTLRQSTNGYFEIRGRRIWADSQQFGSQSVWQDLTVTASVDFISGAVRCWVLGVLVHEGSFHSGGVTDDADSSQAGIFEGLVDAAMRRASCKASSPTSKRSLSMTS